MKKLTILFGAILALCIGFQACSNTKTYAEMLEEEDDAISAFIADSSIVVIEQSVFHANDSTTDVSKNEYVHLASGVYMQIIDKCKGWSEAKTDAERQALWEKADTVRNNDIVLARLYEYSLIDEAYTYSNYNMPYTVDEFRYTVTSTSIAATFTGGSYRYNTGSIVTAVPAGWLVPFVYVRDGARIRLIVPSKMGSTSAMQSVYPYYYELKFQLYR